MMGQPKSMGVSMPLMLSALGVMLALLVAWWVML
jgi:hypothetical protein